MDTLSHEGTRYGPDRTSLLTREQVAEQLGISWRTVARLAADGELPRVRFGRATRYRPEDVRALVNAHLDDERPAGRPGAVTSDLGEDNLAEEGDGPAETGPLAESLPPTRGGSI